MNENLPKLPDELQTVDSTCGEQPKSQARATAVAGADSAVGQIAGRYELREKIAEGGMGIVYQAFDHTLMRDVAIKTTKRVEADGNAVRRFLAESRISGQLQHPGIPPVHDLGTLDDGRPFLAMKLIKGRTLAEMLKHRTALEYTPFLPVFEQICQALAYAHSRGVIHRDLKPANIMVGAFGEVQVMDWGLAKVLGEQPTQAEPDPETTRDDASRIHDPRNDSDSPDTYTGFLIGTEAYIAPEQALGEKAHINQRSDVFGLGAILCVILTGKPPYVGPDVRIQARSGKLDECWERLDASKAEPELIALAKRCLDPEPARRPANAGAVAEAMASFRSQAAERARQAELERVRAEGEREKAQVQAAAERKKRQWQLAVGAATALLLLVSGLGMWSWRHQRSVASTRQKAVDEKTQAALDQAGSHLESAWNADIDGALVEVKAEAEKAMEIALSGGASADLQEQAAAFHREVTARLTQWGKNQRLRAALLDVFEPRTATLVDYDKNGYALPMLPLEDQFAQAFREWGLDIDHLQVGEIVARLQAQPARFVQEVIVGLDWWALDRRAHQRPDWKPLHEIAESLDTDGPRRELRNLMVRALNPGMWWQAMQFPIQLRKMAAAIDPSTAPVMVIVTLTGYLRSVRDYARAADLLRQASDAHPNDATMLIQLASTLCEMPRPQYAKALECYRAARALRPDTGLGMCRTLLDCGRADEAETVARDLLRRHPDHPMVYTYLGIALSTQKKWDEAAVYVRKAIELQPEFGPAYNTLGIGLRRQKRLDEAVAALRKATEFNPSESAPYLNLGNALHDQRKLDEAIACYRKAIELEPRAASAYNSLGLVFRDQHKYVEAEAALRKAIQLKPDYATAVTNLGLVLEARGKRAEALAAHRKALEVDPNDRGALTNLGGMLLAEKKVDEALVLFLKALDLEPDSALHLFNVGLALHRQKKFDQAAAVLQRSIELEPDNARHYTTLGEVLRDQKKPAEAVQLLQKAIALDPRSGRAWLLLAHIRSDQNNQEEAAAAYRKAIEAESGLPEKDLSGAYNDLGVCFGMLGKLDEAVAALRKASEIRPNDGVVYTNLGKALEKQKKLPEAAAAWRRASELNPTSKIAHQQLGIVLRDQGKREEAISAFRKAADVNVENFYVCFEMGQLLNDLKKFDESELAYRAALKRKPNWPEAYNNLGLVLREQKKLEEAAAAYCKAIELKADLRQPNENLVSLLRELKKLDEAVPVYRKVFELQPKNAGVHYDLAKLYHNERKYDAAAAEFRKTIELQPNNAEAYSDLGWTLFEQRKFDESVTALRRAVELKPDFAFAYNRLGLALRQQQKPDEAMAVHRKVITFSPNYAWPHHNLGVLLREQGKFEEALAELRKAQQLLPGEKEISDNVRETELLVELDKKLRAILDGKEQPGAAKEQIEIAHFSGDRRHYYRTAVQLYSDAFAADPKLADDPNNGNRYNAACCAALAGAGKGEDAAKLDEVDRAGLRKKAFDWLRADLSAWGKMLETDPPRQRAMIEQNMRHWQTEADLANVRDAAELEKLPAVERDAWRQFWADVESLRKKASEAAK
jgi:tetratricopeptide (TPR) repeat protein